MSGSIIANDSMSVKFDRELCDLNPYCPVTRVCPTGAMFIDRKTFRPAFDESKCTGCEVCIPSCPHGAIKTE
jgi:Fe-S-cluster-containing hydrogenase component 2